MAMYEAVVVEMLQKAEDLDDLGRDMVKTKCSVNGKVMNVYVQHPVDNVMIDVGYTFMLPLNEQN